MYQKTTLDNGICIVTETMPYTRAVSVCVFLGVGSRYETDAEAGVSHFIEHLLFKGTANRPTPRILSEAIEGVGGVFNGATDREITVYWCKVPQPHFNLALDVLADMLLGSKFDPEDVEKERRVIIEEINMSTDSPEQQVDININQLLWPGQPLGRDVAGSKESVSAITRDTILGYMRREYQPSNTVVAIAGNISHEKVVADVARLLGKWTNNATRPGYLPATGKVVQRVSVETRDTEQVHLCLALPGLSLRHPQRFSFDLLNAILGEGMGSRLFSEIRDRLCLAYSINSYTDHFLDSGSLIVAAGVNPQNLTTAVKAIVEQLSLLRENIPEDELTKAKEMSKGRLMLRLEDSRSMAGWLGGQETMLGKILTVDDILGIIEVITTEDLKELARGLIRDSEFRLAVVGPGIKPEPLEDLLKI